MGDFTYCYYLISPIATSSIGWHTRAHLEGARALFPLFTSVSCIYLKRVVNSVADALATQARASTIKYHQLHRFLLSLML
ncbi:hypothetical protein BVC80_8623g4 [Macleaya cordata]|uniref:RNase H type-1 domain-containing protein n=1 Tax=Macleaya cordata TaxID=56857 RepID=A0A200PYK0_MACCD|nr:hypothetical protein BVC80_8623g4 [Macleaya cordata]